MKLLHSTPILSDTTSTGKRKYWQGHAAEDDTGNVYTFTEFWQEGAKKQMSAPTLVKGKNIGKTNETLPKEQAISEIDSDADKKRQKGYKPWADRELKATRQLDVEQESEGYERALPMLAHSYKKRSHNISWPCDAQPKLDGVRALTDGKWFWSRQGNVFPAATTEHLRMPLPTTDRVVAKLGGRILQVDGEIMLDPNEHTFEETISALKDETPDQFKLALSRKLRFHVFDVVDPTAPWEHRREWLEALFDKGVPENWRLVPTTRLNSALDLQGFLDECMAGGHEGVILRNLRGPYTLKHRSKDLQKHKPFVDEEFEIVGVREGEGKDVGTPIYTCKMSSGLVFDARPVGTYDHRRKLWRNRAQLIGKFVTVTYQNLTADGKPRFPVAKAIRDYE